MSRKPTFIKTFKKEKRRKLLLLKMQHRVTMQQ